MKKIFFSIALMLISLCLHAQRPVGSFSFIPRAGLSIANLTGNEICYRNGETDAKKSSRYNARFAGGVDVEYQVLPLTSISLGAYYAQQGCRFPDFEPLREGFLPLDNIMVTSHFREKLDYVQVPLMINQYITTGLAVKVGVQMGLLTSAQTTYDETTITKKKDGTEEIGNKEHYDIDMKETLNKMDISIPVGFSYEYERVVLDLRYNIGLKNIYKENLSEKNKSFTITVGYHI